MSIPTTSSTHRFVIPGSEAVFEGPRALHVEFTIQAEGEDTVTLSHGERFLTMGGVCISLDQLDALKAKLNDLPWEVA